VRLPEGALEDLITALVMVVVLLIAMTAYFTYVR
jgi:hypothetical protein